MFRPSDIRIRRSTETGEDIAAEVVFMQRAGTLPRIELKRLDTDETVHVELPRGQYREPALNLGEQVYIQSTNIRVFGPDCQI